MNINIADFFCSPLRCPTFRMVIYWTICIPTHHHLLSGHSWMSNNCNYFTFHGWIRFSAQSQVVWAQWMVEKRGKWFEMIDKKKEKKRKENDSNCEKKSWFIITIACWDNKTMLFYSTLLCFATLIARSTNSVELADEKKIGEIRIENFFGPVLALKGIFLKKLIFLLLSNFFLEISIFFLKRKFLAPNSPFFANVP